MIKNLIGAAVLTTSLMASYGQDEKKIFVELDIWQVESSGDISNSTSNTNYESDLGFSDGKNVTAFEAGYKSDMKWVPSVKVGYFVFNSTENNTLSSAKTIGGTAFSSGTVLSTSVDYSELNTILYKTIENGIIEFDIGANIKNISFSQNTKDTASSNNVGITGPGSMLIMPYVGVNINLDGIDTVLSAQSSLLAFGDDEARDMKLGVTYKATDNLILGLGHKVHSWSSTSSDATQDKYDFKLSGNYFSIKLVY